MNTAILLMSAALTSGPAFGGGKAPDCGGCAAPAPSCSTACEPACGPRVSMMDRIKACFAKKKKSDDCCPAPSCAPACAAPAPAPCAPAPVVACAPAPCAPAPVVACAPAPVACAPACEPACDPCAKKPGLLARIKARLCKPKNNCCEVSTCSSCATGGCSTGAPAVAPAAPVETPKEMPKPKDEPKKPTTTLAPSFNQDSTASRY